MPARGIGIQTPAALGIREVPKGLLLPDHLPFQDWLAYGHRLGKVTGALMWRIADWLFYGEGEYGSRYQEGMDATGLDYQTCRNYATVAGRYDLSLRKDNLSFSHHMLLTRQTDEAIHYWLDKAEAEHWSFHRLHDELKTAGVIGSTPRELEPSKRRLSLAYDPERVSKWETAAQHRGIPLEEFAAQAMDEAAAQELAEAA
jgi:hypothetical protein